jgi:outer membrane protein assembly factor BamB
MWSFDAGGEVTGSPVVAGYVMVASADSYLHLLTYYGAVQWSYALSAPTTVALVASADNLKVFAHCSNGDVISVSTDLWKSDWHKLLSTEFSGPTAAADTPVLDAVRGQLYVTSYAAVFALDRTNGLVVWIRDFRTLDVSINRLALGSDGTLYVAASNNVLALNYSSGSTLWNTSSTGLSLSLALGLTVGADDTVYTADQNVVYAFNGTTGAVKWTHAVTDGSTLGISGIDKDGTLFLMSTKAFAIGLADDPRCDTICLCRCVHQADLFMLAVISPQALP